MAETVTGGQISRRLSAHPEVFGGGAVAADGETLGRILGVDPLPVEAGELAVVLAQALQQNWGASCGLAVVGAGEEGPWVAVSGEGVTATRQLRFRGSDRRAGVWTTSMALEFVRRLLLDLADGWGE